MQAPGEADVVEGRVGVGAAQCEFARELGTQSWATHTFSAREHFDSIDPQAQQNPLFLDL